MKRSVIVLSCLLTMLLTSAAPAQREGRQREGRQREGRQREGRQAGRRGTPPTHPLMTLLDTDGDGEISAAEIANAVAALKKLDRNQDGKLTVRELPRLRSSDRRAPGQGGDRGGPRQFIQRILSLDKNQDGQIAKDEMPAERQRLFDRADRNGDGVLDQNEIEQLARERGGARRGAARGDRRNRPGPGERPERPRRPDDNS